MTDALTPDKFATLVEDVRDHAFGWPFYVSPAGCMAVRLYTPDVFHDEERDVDVHGTGWEPLTGYTGQYGYNGAVLHPSEFLSDRMVRDMINDPGIYAAAVVECLPTDDDEDPEPAGWVVLRYVGDL